MSSCFSMYLGQFICHISLDILLNNSILHLLNNQKFWRGFHQTIIKLVSCNRFGSIKLSIQDSDPVRSRSWCWHISNSRYISLRYHENTICSAREPENVFNDDILHILYLQKQRSQRLVCWSYSSSCWDNALHGTEFRYL